MLFITPFFFFRLWFDELIGLWVSVQNLPQWEGVSILFFSFWQYISDHLISNFTSLELALGSVVIIFCLFLNSVRCFLTETDTCLFCFYQYLEACACIMKCKTLLLYLHWHVVRNIVDVLFMLIRLKCLLFALWMMLCHFPFNKHFNYSWFKMVTIKTEIWRFLKNEP